MHIRRSPFIFRVMEKTRKQGEKPGKAQKTIIVTAALFTLRGTTPGCGTLGDIPALSRWCKDAGAMRVHLLPLFDTGPDEPSPYRPVSSFALSPLYLDLSPWKEELDLHYLEKLEKEPELHYAQVYREKRRLAQMLFEAGKLVEKPLDDPHLEKHLKAYAAFKLLRDKYPLLSPTQWPAPWSKSRKAFKRAQNILQWRTRLEFELALARCLWHQLSTALRESALPVICDIPASVQELSCDLWERPKAFKKGWSLGAPPDEFAASGQKWDVLPLSWDDHPKAARRALIEKVRIIGRHAGGVRIDHVLGCFRAWVTKGQSDRHLKHFVPSQAFLSPRALRRRAQLSAAQLRELQREKVPEWAQKILSDDKTYQDKAPFRRNRLRQELSQREKGLVFSFGGGRPRFSLNLSYPSSFAFRTLPQDLQTAWQRTEKVWRAHIEYQWARAGTKTLRKMRARVGCELYAENLGVTFPAISDALELSSIRGTTMLQFKNLFPRPSNDVLILSNHDTEPLTRQITEPEFQQGCLELLGITGAEISPSLKFWELFYHKVASSPFVAVSLSLCDIFALYPDAVPSFSKTQQRINVPGDFENSWKVRLPFGLDKLMEITEPGQRLHAFLSGARGEPI